MSLRIDDKALNGYNPGIGCLSFCTPGIRRNSTPLSGGGTVFAFSPAVASGVLYKFILFHLSASRLIA